MGSREILILTGGMMRMTNSWTDVKQEILSISGEEKRELERIARLASLLSQRRRMLGMTQEEVAEKAGVTQANIARIEKAKMVPRIDTLFKIAFALGLEITLTPSRVVDEEAAATAFN
jgi:DNA-binding XRE family transcriptional regulator